MHLSSGVDSRTYDNGVQIRVWRIFGYSNIFKYFPIQIFVCIIFVSFFIRIYSNICLYHFLIQIYSDIRLYHFFDTNIFKRKNLTCALKSPKVKWLKLFTHRLIYKEKLLPLCCVNYVLTFSCITHQNPTSNIKSKI